MRGQREPVSRWVVRAPTARDARAVADLVAVYDAAAFGAADYSVDDLRAEWADTGFRLATDALVVATAAGPIIGYVALTHCA